MNNILSPEELAGLVVKLPAVSPKPGVARASKHAGAYTPSPTAERREKKRRKAERKSQRKNRR